MARTKLSARIRKTFRTVVIAAGKRIPNLLNAAREVNAALRRYEFRRLWHANPVDPNVIVFEAYAGRSYACSPRALYRAMLADPAYDGVEKIWALRRSVVLALQERGGYDIRGVEGVTAGQPKPIDLDLALGAEALEELRHAVIVPFGSPEYRRSYARAALWVSNAIIPTYFYTRPGQRYLQTWHGTPLKRLGCDIRHEASQNVLFSVDEIHERYQREGARFTYLVSPSPYATDKLGSAFDLLSTGRKDAILEEGYPRNDRLSDFNADDVERIKARIGVPEGKKVVLYAPTWRDNKHVSGLGYTYDVEADFELLQAALGDDCVVLFRAHYLIADSFDFGAHEGFVIDVSRIDDINDVYIISDMLITDYSSVFFDYANLGRPVVFYMYDLEHYAGELRGFYLQPEELPGPVAQTTEELIEAIRLAEDPGADEHATLARFREHYAPLDDGHASQRVLARIFPDRGARPGSGA